MDWNDYLKMIKEGTQKALDPSQELNEPQKKERTNGSLGYLQPKAEGSPAPAPVAGTFERSVTSRPTVSSHLSKFTISEDFQSRNFFKKSKKNEIYISENDLNKLNKKKRPKTIQKAAQYYRDELANSTVSYFLSNGNIASINFKEKHFMHLTGIHPLGKDQTPEKTLHDFAEGEAVIMRGVKGRDNAGRKVRRILFFYTKKQVFRTDICFCRMNLTNR